MLREAITAACRTPVLGWLPRELSIAIPERHLGLHGAMQAGSLDEAEALEAQMDTLARLAEAHLAVDQILALQCGMDLSGELSTAAPAVRRDPAEKKLRIGVARDAAFFFYYEDNLDLLREHRAEIVPFSPVQDRELPANLDALYLGGGYPELEAEQLAANHTMREQVRAFAASGGVIYAECGGMMYLANSLATLDGGVHAMAGVLPMAMEMTPRLVDFGYVEVALTRDCLLGLRGTAIRGHSFHTSRIVAGSGDGAIEASYHVRFSLSGKEQAEGFARGKVLASYAHLHFRANRAVVPHLMQEIRAARHARQREAACA
jgi:cobyrinic acid a,c-diamide synthase